MFCCSLWDFSLALAVGGTKHPELLIYVRLLENDTFPEGIQ